MTMPTFFRESTLNDLLKLNIADRLFLAKIMDKTFDENEFFNNLSANINIDFIIKIAEVNDEFAALCKRDKLSFLWDESYATLLSLATPADRNKPTQFFKQNNACSFELLRGAYFFLKSHQQKIKAKTDFSYEELIFLKKAVQYNSIHAIQRFNQYIYLQSENETSDSEKEIKNLLKECIVNCKKLTPVYGSYAYMMLAEAFAHYSRWAEKKSELKDSKAAMNASLVAVENSDKYLEQSKYAIHNASFGGDLKYSNSFQITSLKEARLFYEKCTDPLSTTHH